MKFSNTALALLFASTSTMASSSFTSGLPQHVPSRRLDKDDDDEGKIKKKHKCELETKDNVKVEFGCKSKTEDSETEFKDEIKFKISSKDGVKIKVEYEQETEMKRRALLRNRHLQEGTIEEIEVETSFEVVFDRIVEYRKPDTTGGRRLTPAEEAYDWETDEIVSEMALTQFTGFTPVDVSRRRRLLENGQESEGVVYTFSLATPDNVAKFDFTIAQDGEAAEGGSVFSSNSMKIDFTMTDYPYKGVGTNVALMSSVESKQEIEIEYADEDDQKGKKDDKKDEVKTIDESEADLQEESEGDGRRNRRRLSRETQEIIIQFSDALAATGIMPFGAFEWAKEAFVTPSNDTEMVRFLAQDGNSTDIVTETIQVVATAAPDGSDRLAFSFVGGEIAKGAPSIYWDPETGVGYSAVSAAWSFGRSVGVAMAAALTLMSFVW